MRNRYLQVRVAKDDPNEEVDNLTTPTPDEMVIEVINATVPTIVKGVIAVKATNFFFNALEHFLTKRF